VNPYEILLLLDPELPEERQSEVVSRVRENVEGAGGVWERHEPWGRRKLAYEIDHRADGFYHLVEFESEPATLDEISRVLKITDGVLRHMAVRRSQTRPTRPLAAVAPSGQDEERTEPTATTAEEGA
jgi:small subunit ribosomal protein S6